MQAKSTATTDHRLSHAVPLQRVALCLMLGAVSHVQAEAPKQDAAAVQALRKAQGLLRQLSQEKTQLETEKAALAEQVKKLEASVKQLEPLQGEVDRQKAALESLRGNNSSLESQVADERGKEQALREKMKEIIGKARQIQSDNHLLVQAVQEREQWIAQCKDKNQRMLEVNGELIDKYKEKGFWDKLSEIEPFTQIGKVKTENAVENFRFKLEDLQITPFQSASKTPAEAKQAPVENSADEDGEEPVKTEQAQPAQQPESPEGQQQSGK